MKVEILYYEISTQLESKLRAKLLKEDELSECYEAIKEKKKHQMKSVKILCIVMAVFFVILTIGAIIGGADRDRNCGNTRFPYRNGHSRLSRMVSKCR